MKVIWLNESLVLRGESKDEKKSLAVIFNALIPDEPQGTTTGPEEANRVPVINPSALSLN